MEKEEQQKQKIQAKIFSFQNGMQEYQNVELIRLKSRQINILIMEDHLPLLGEITGSIEILADGEQIMLENIDGYYMHKKNSFELVLKE